MYKNVVKFCVKNRLAGIKFGKSVFCNKRSNWYSF